MAATTTTTTTTKSSLSLVISFIQRILEQNNNQNDETIIKQQEKKFIESMSSSSPSVVLCKQQQLLFSESILSSSSSFHYNIFLTFLMILYFKSLLEIIIWLRTFYSNYYSKQVLYIALSSCYILFWPFYIRTDECWSWRFNVVVPFAMLVRFIYKGMIISKDAQQEDIEVQIISNASISSELLFGPLQYCIVLIYIGLYQFMTMEGIIIIAAVGIGDSLAPIIGTWCGRHVYQSNPLSSIKTMEGSIVGIFLGTVVSTYLFLHMMPNGCITILPLRIILVYGGIAAVVEGTSPSNMDNILVPIVLHFSMDRVEQWLPA